MRDLPYVYDVLQRLTSGGTTLEAETYEYDLQGNRLNSHLSATHVTNDVDRLLEDDDFTYCLLYTSPSPRDQRGSRMPSSA